MTTASEPYVLNMGPQHPSTHGVFRLRVVMDGERIQDIGFRIGLAAVLMLMIFATLNDIIHLSSL